MSAVCATFEAARKRVEVLKGSGIWPGIRCRAGGTRSLTFDPQDTAAKEASQ